MNIYDWQIDVLRRVVDGGKWCPHEHEVGKGEEEVDGSLVVWITCKDPDEPVRIGTDRFASPRRFEEEPSWSADLLLFTEAVMERHERDVARKVLAQILGELEDQNTTDKRLTRVEATVDALFAEVRYLMKNPSNIGPIG